MKTYLRAFLNKLGWDLHRLPVNCPVAEPSAQSVTIGRHAIKFPASSRIPQSYSYYPNYGRELTTAARLVSTKYPQGQMIDVGANVGDTIALIRLATETKVYAYEADQSTLGFLRENARALGAVEIVEKYLDAQPGTRSIDVQKDGWNNTLRPGTGGKSMVFTTLDQEFPSAPGAPLIKLIKVDTEGFDTRILSGAGTLLTGSHPVLMFEYHTQCLRELGENGLAIFPWLESHGYEQAVAFDHAGAPLVAASLAQRELWSQLDRYTARLDCPICYLDLVCFHRSDSDLAEQFWSELTAPVKGSS